MTKDEYYELRREDEKQFKKEMEAMRSEFKWLNRIMTLAVVAAVIKWVIH